MTWFNVRLDYISNDKGFQQRWFISKDLALEYVARLRKRAYLRAYRIIEEQ